MVESIQQEIDLEVLEVMLESFEECITIAGPNSLNEEQQKQVCVLIKALIEDYQTRTKERDESAQDQDFDQEEGERLEDEREKEEDILSNVVEVIGQMIKTHKEQFLHCLNEILPIFIQMLQPNRPAHERQVALCIFDDIVEHGGFAHEHLFSATTNSQDF